MYSVISNQLFKMEASSSAKHEVGMEVMGDEAIAKVALEKVNSRKKVEEISGCGRVMITLESILRCCCCCLKKSRRLRMTEKAKESVEEHLNIIDFLKTRAYTQGMYDSLFSPQTKELLNHRVDAMFILKDEDEDEGDSPSKV